MKRHAPALGRFGLLLVLALSVVASGCGQKKDKKEPAQAAGLRACRTNDDCDRGWFCLAGKCADARTKAIYTAPSTAVTPEKVKQEIEAKQEQHHRQVDSVLERAAGPR